MAQKIPIPAETARQMATEATEDIHRHREAGRKHSAKDLEQRIAETFEALDGKDGEFVSLSATTVSTLAAESTLDVPEYVEGARVYLEQYGVW
jgi:hypothetical protein